MGKETQRIKIRKWLLAGKRLTPLMALQKGWGYRLAGHIYVYRHRDGLLIHTDIDPQTGHAIYWLDESQVIRRAGL